MSRNFILPADRPYTVVLILVTACAAIANIVKSSLGPVGLDKMLVDDVGVSHFLSNSEVEQYFSFY